MSRWISDEQVNRAQETGDFSALEANEIPFCMSPDRTYCILVRDHAAWQIEGEGWREGNYAPGQDGEGRCVINFFKCQRGDDTGFWYKTLVPTAVRIVGLRSVDSTCFEVATENASLKAAYSRLDGLMWDLMTGNAQTEDDIEAAFAGIWQ